MKLVFMGTPEFAAATLKALLEAGHEVACAYSQPPRPADRGQKLKLSAVHEFANSRGIEVRAPVSLKGADARKEFASLAADAAVVVAYGLLLPQAVLDAPRLGCFNVHASLLPRWRGAAPIQRAIMAGDRETGVCIMRMEAGLDTGPICRTARLAIGPATTAGSLHDALAELGAGLMVETLAQPAVPCAAQSDAGVTYARKIEKSETRIDFAKPAAEARNHVHGLSPFPGAWTMVNGSRIKVLNCEVVERSGAVGVALDDQLVVGCGVHALRLTRLQREGREARDAGEFLRGFPVPAGSRFA
jgi:methionyl-tRNA formyltransferase